VLWNITCKTHRELLFMNKSKEIWVSPENKGATGYVQTCGMKYDISTSPCMVSTTVAWSTALDPQLHLSLASSSVLSEAYGDRDAQKILRCTIFASLRSSLLLGSESWVRVRRKKNKIMLFQIIHSEYWRGTHSKLFYL
jgi:hypothetical protein